jgi:hypothetical protein
VIVSATPVAEEHFHLGAPLGVRRAAQAVAVGEEAGPVFPTAALAVVLEALAPEILGPLLGVEVVGVPPEPRGERFVLVGGAVAAGDALVRGGLRHEESFERRAGEFAGIPGIVGGDLRIANPGAGAGGNDACEEEECEESGHCGTRWESRSGIDQRDGILTLPRYAWESIGRFSMPAEVSQNRLKCPPPSSEPESAASASPGGS